MRIVNPIINLPEEYQDKKKLPVKKALKIGSKHIGKIEFDMKDHFFHLDDKHLDIKSSIKDSIDPDILVLKKPIWNGSSSKDPGPRVNQEKHLFNV